MIRINANRVIVGGLVAGFVVLLSGLALAHFVLGEEYVAKFKTTFPKSQTEMIATHVGMRIGFGIVAVYLSAAMRPRFGSREKSAVVAGVALWLLAYVPLSMSLRSLNLLVGGQFVIVLAWGLAEAILATTIGSSFYRETRR